MGFTKWIRLDIFPHGWVFAMDGQLPHPDQAGLRIFRNGNLSTTLGTAQFRPEKKTPQLRMWKSGVVVFGVEKSFGGKPSPSTLRVFWRFAALLEKNGKNLGFSRECRLLWDSKNGGGLFKKGVLIIPIVSCKFLVTFPGFWASWRLSVPFYSENIALFGIPFREDVFF